MADGYKEIGIIVRVVDYKEADKIISVVTQSRGLNTYIALGARRSSSKKSPHLDLFNLIKFDIGRGGSPAFLNQVDTENYYLAVKKDFTKVRLAMTFSEIIYQILPEESEDSETFHSLKNFLEALCLASNVADMNKLANKFGRYLLRHFGYPPPPESGGSSLTGYFETIINKKIIGKEIR